MERDQGPERGPNEESQLDADPELTGERLEASDLVADGLIDEENLEAQPDAPDRMPALNGDGPNPTDEATPMLDLDSMAKQVAALLLHKEEDEPLDIYAWSDGTVTNGEMPTHETAYLVSLFSPDNELAPAQIRAMLNEGFEAVRDELARTGREKDPV